LKELAGIGYRDSFTKKKEEIIESTAQVVDQPTQLDEVKDEGEAKTYKLGLVEIHDLKDQDGFIFVIESEGTYEKKNGAFILANFLGLSMHDTEPKKIAHGFVSWDGEAIHFAKNPEDIAKKKEFDAKHSKDE
jgi:hypothetical protein